MMREETVFGPIFSRRLGSSLGINLLPEKGKLCNFDCIYCECGWNKDGRGDVRMPSAQRVAELLEAKLADCRERQVSIDSITFSGDGEPTLNPAFPEIIDATLSLRDRYYPAAVVSVLTNATRLGYEEVASALKKVDNPILKLDAPSDEEAMLINHALPGYHVEDVVHWMEGFGGNFVLQTMFLKAPGWESARWAGRWMDIVRRIKPREIMVYTLDRETPMKGLQKYTVEQMREIVSPLIEEGYNIQIKG